MIRHVVQMTLKDGTTSATLTEMGQALDQCAANVDYIVAMQHGPNIEIDTPSPKAGYAVVIDFETMEDCLRYDHDPEHDVVRKVVMPNVAGALVTNFEF